MAFVMLILGKCLQFIRLKLRCKIAPKEEIYSCKPYGLGDQYTFPPVEITKPSNQSFRMTIVACALCGRIILLEPPVNGIYIIQFRSQDVAYQRCVLFAIDGYDS